MTPRSRRGFFLFLEECYYKGRKVKRKLFINSFIIKQNNMLNEKIFIISLIFLGLWGFSFSVQAMLISQVDFINFSMEKASFTVGEEIRGDFTLKNYEKEVVPDITYSYRLLAEDSDGSYKIILDEKFSGDNFSIRPDQKITKSFSYRLPQNLPSGSYKFRVQLFNSKGICCVCIILLLSFCDFIWVKYSQTPSRFYSMVYSLSWSIYSEV